jgi:hypothetical protein
VRGIRGISLQIPCSRSREKEGSAAKLWEDEDLLLLLCFADALNEKKTLIPTGIG